MSEADLRYPIGKWQREDSLSPEKRGRCIEEIEAAPSRLRSAVKGLTASQLDTAYRPGGWSVRQLVHHVPDSHMNAYTRFKLALTEDVPTIKAYDEARWAELGDSQTTPVEASLVLLESLHVRWVNLLRSLAPADFSRQFKHPEHGSLTLDATLSLYAWHGRHHATHITSLRERNGWH
jgi:hypothetical protein